MWNPWKFVEILYLLEIFNIFGKIFNDDVEIIQNLVYIGEFNLISIKIDLNFLNIK
jgi:hypothetical protein